MPTENHESFHDQVMEEEQPIVNAEIAELEKPIENIIEQLRPAIERGEYGLIISDDTSGRVPERIIEGVIKGVYDRLDHQRPTALFIAGSGAHKYDFELTPGQIKSKQEQIRKTVKKYINACDRVAQPHRRALIVTETIDSGLSLAPLAGSLQAEDIEYDFASVALVGADAKRQEDKELLLGGKIYYAQKNTPSIFGKHGLSGVTKSPSSTHAEKAFGPGDEPGQQIINQARADAGIVTKNILRRYWEKHPIPEGQND